MQKQLDLTFYCFILVPLLVSVFVCLCACFRFVYLFCVYLWPPLFTFCIRIYCPWKRDNETTKKKQFYALDRWSTSLFGFMKTLLSFWLFGHLFVIWGCKQTSVGTLLGLRVLSIQKMWRKIMWLTATIMIMTMITIIIIIIMNMTTDMVTLNIFSVYRQKMFVLACHPVLASWFQSCCFVAMMIYNSFLTAFNACEWWFPVPVIFLQTFMPLLFPLIRKNLHI